ncbi:hypothetical protein EDD15DRAFT_2367808 [Pisolithus albus]|nr:hypothetical protein EDD15DRAFT_2367808 [Pisolithus albus]
MESNDETEHDFATDNDAAGRDETEEELIPWIDREEDAFDVVELEILARRRREWTQARKKEKPAVLGEICRELGKLEKYRDLSPVEWHQKREEITAWLKKPLRTRKPRITVRSGYKYSVRAVIRELYHDQIQQKHARMKEEEGSHNDTKRIDLYQRALTAFMQDDLTEDQLQAARDIVEKWNGADGPTPEVQVRNAARYGPAYIRNFAEEMWRYCGMRMVFMTGWKDEKGVVQACCMDYNSEIGGGTAFDDLGTLNPSWREYLGKSFEDADLADDEEPLSKGKQNPRMKKPDPVRLVTNEQGDIWIGEIKGCSRDQLQQMIRRFLTAHYRKACGRQSASVPFKKLGQYQQDMIAAHHLPANFTFNVDPSHLHSSTATELLNFWRERQVTNPNDVFSFQKRLDQSGNLQPPVDGNTLPLMIARNRKKKSAQIRPDDSLDDEEEADPQYGITQSKAATRIRQKTPALGKRPRLPSTDEEMDGDTSDSEEDELQNLPSCKYKAQTKGSGRGRRIFHKQGKRYTAELQDRTEDGDNDDYDSVPFADERDIVPESSSQNGGRTILKPALKRSSGIPRRQAADAANASSTDPGHSRSQPRKSPRVPKKPVPADANVPSPMSKPTRKHNAATSKQTRKSNAAASKPTRKNNAASGRAGKKAKQ